MQRSAATVVCVVGDVDVVALARANVSALSPPKDLTPLERAARATDAAGGAHAPYFVHDADPLALHGPQSIVFHQAALDTDGANWLAANELGVLFARYGQLGDARRLLLHSVTIHPHVEGWQNLAVVHRRLGESDLAQRAEQEGRMVAQRTGQSTTSSEMVHWVDPRAFAATGGQDVHWPATEADKAVAASPSAPGR